MNNTRLKQACRLFFHDLAPAHISRHNARQWARSLRQLGNGWLLAKPIEVRNG